MRSLLFGACVCFLLTGCSKPDTAANAEPAPPVVPPGAASAGSGGSIAPVGANIGGATPIVGTESLGGTSGGGVAQAAKDRARSSANRASTAQPGDDGGSDDGDQ